MRGVDSEKDVLEDMKGRVFSTSGRFAAPLHIVEAVRAAVELPFQQGLAKERDLFDVLSKSSQAPAMQYQFFSERSVSEPPAVADKSKVPSIASVGVVGGGTMGAGIAMSFANAGIPVTLVETSSELADKAVKRIESTYKASSAYKSGKMSDDKVTALTALITPSGDLSAVGGADLVVEAVFENMEAKREIFSKLSRLCKDSAIMATNTSYLDIDSIAQATDRPGQVIGTRKNASSDINDC